MATCAENTDLGGQKLLRARRPAHGACGHMQRAMTRQVGKMPDNCSPWWNMPGNSMKSLLLAVCIGAGGSVVVGTVQAQQASTLSLEEVLAATLVHHGEGEAEAADASAG